MRLKSLIVDDEKNSRDLLRAMLKDHCPEVEVIGEADNVASAGLIINSRQPDLVFLDIQMPGGSAFEFAENMVKKKGANTVFVTAYNQYALNAIKAGASDYILKPIDIEELQQSVKKIVKKREEESEPAIQLNNETLLIPHTKGFKLVDTSKIIRLEADNNYTTLFLTDGNKIIASKGIKDFEDKLSPSSFSRIHKSHIINLTHFTEYLSEEGSTYAVMCDGSKVAISRLKASEFLAMIGRMASRL